MKSWLARPFGAALVAAALAASGGGIYVASQAGGEAATANLWVDQNGGSCARSGTQTGYEGTGDSQSCNSFSAAYAAASGGDTIRVKAGTYTAPQSTGGSKTPAITVTGEDGTVIQSIHNAGQALQGFSLSGNVTVSNVDVGGDQPFIFIGGDNSTWRDSTLLESSNSDSAARGAISGTTPEPILIYSDEATINDAAVINVVVEPQYHCTPGLGTCPSGDGYHLEAIRIDQNVDGVLVDRVTFADGGEYGSGHIFITRPNSGATNPSNITIRNSVFGALAGSYNIEGGSDGVCTNWTFAYNTFRSERALSCQSGSSVLWVGNIGPKSANGVNCTPGTTWTRNVWQWNSDPRVCSGESANNTWAQGPNFEIGALGLNATYRPLTGSVVISAGEAHGASDYCTGALGAVDRDGATRDDPCWAGAYQTLGAG